MARRHNPPAPNVSSPDTAFEEYAGFGTENIREDDTAWLGEDGSVDPDVYLRAIEAEGALREIFRHIVASHPSRLESTAKSRTPEDDRVQKMMEAALGRPPRRGPPPLNKSQILIAVAAKYFSSRFELKRASPGRNVSMDRAIWEVLVELGGEDPDLDIVAKGNAIRPIRAAFKRDKDRLITLITSDGREALDERDRKISQVVRLLRELGILDPGSMKGLE